MEHARTIERLSRGQSEETQKKRRASMVAAKRKETNRRQKVDLRPFRRISTITKLPSCKRPVKLFRFRRSLYRIDQRLKAAKIPEVARTVVR
jgi:hypothetical protein